MSNVFDNAKIRTRPPFRADVVGSFLRPESVKTARRQFKEGSLSAGELRNVEDEAIADLVEKEKQNGLSAVTDGEFRRSWWHLDFMAGLDGLEMKVTDNGFTFNGVHTRAESVELKSRIKFGEHPMLSHFAFLQQCAGDHVAKMTIPSPAMLHFVLTVRNQEFELPDFYPNEESFIEDIVKAYRNAIAAFYKAGCRYLQLDDTSWGALCSTSEREAFAKRGIDPDKLAELYVAIINQVIEGRPEDMVITMHICRGNYRSTWFSSGGYDPVAPILFANARLDGFFLEYDSDRSGDFAPLRHIKDQQVVLGLVTSKTGEMEDKNAVKARIAEAAAILPINQLCLSPQCGFSSTEEGNTLSEEQQWAKVRFIKEIADEIWK
ncbi:5-methyltetrahydropteroyltriglutamate--homocysteine S-methyltransferase [Pseudodesulfovibrio sp.]|uniref:5-methyltetrahydropteroyltriglutamate-- homocysteine S-methyltransferase n=1 Tax=unclassified Pseudodesulfovibrio TaxID=2661612 RepID=UPI003B0017BA